jgi:hypothetical protein
MATIRGHVGISPDDDDALHGGVIRVNAPYPKADAELEALAQRFHQAIERGLAVLDSGTSPKRGRLPG